MTPQRIRLSSDARLYRKSKRFALDAMTPLSATALTNFVGCVHLARLDHAARNGGPKPPKYDDPALEVLKLRGLEHEQAFEDQLRTEGLHVIRVEEPDRTLPRADYWTRYTAATLDLMNRGVEVIVQGGLWDGRWVGKPDFLRRTVRSDDRPTYEVIDTKLARDAKGGALLQILHYADLVEHVFGAGPERVHLRLAGPDARMETFRVADYAAYFRTVCASFLGFQETLTDEIPHAADPVAHCGICGWRARCEEERRDVDHLSLVAGISRRQRDALRAAGVDTLAGLARLDLATSPQLDGVTQPGLQRIREQARIQLEGRLADEMRYELLPVAEGQGLASLPEPSPGDLFFDLEGNPFAFTFGLEYLFGYVEPDGTYHGRWALNRQMERRAFEAFIDFVMARLDEHPDMHIYHFAPYEQSALRRLMGLHATREAEVDRLLRGGVLVDLHRTVRQSLRASVESYSIKKLEPLYGYAREEDLRDASSALAYFDAWLEMGMFEERNGDLVAAIERYNRDDCLSTLQLREWLESLHSTYEASTGRSLLRPAPRDGTPDEKQDARAAEVAQRYERLMAEVPEDEEDRTEEQRARWLLAQLLEFHRREGKAFWWEYFRCVDLTDEERIEDRSTLGGLTYEGVVAEVKRSAIHRYRFPPQGHSIRDKARDPDTEASAGEVVDIDELAGTIDLKRSKSSTAPHPRSLVPFDQVGDVILRDSILRVADGVIASGLSDGPPATAVADLLLRKPPRLHGGSGGELLRSGETPLDAACRIVTQLDRTVLPIQGPPGAGKTYTGARMILRALEAGKRVGITATSHKVIGNLLKEVCKEARARGVPLSAMQKANEEQWCREAEVATGDNDDILEVLQSGGMQLAAGTAWLWSREEMIGAVDLLFIDEAGQFSLASTVAVAPAAESLVLLGDPRQLEQPQQGVHPPGTDVSVLDHLLAGAITVPGDRGLFLEKTYRLTPTICAFTSEIFYDGRLESREGLERQTLTGPEQYRGSGLRLVPVEHSGNQSESVEEAEVVRDLVAALTASCGWIDDKGIERRMTLEDVLIVTPYNVQVAAIASRLPAGARVGTVDKFQGQEAPVVIYSMASSSAEEAPRGMEFLYSPNRINVATSRARCMAIVVSNPALFVPMCRTPKQMKLANAFCRYRELAEDMRFPQIPVVS